jgi:hypothetical protein
MAAHVTRGEGVLYDSLSEKVISGVSYQLHEEIDERGNHGRWYGELTLIDYVRISDGDRYIIELEDKRKGRCSLNRRTNKATLMVPPRFFYLYKGSSELK